MTTEEINEVIQERVEDKTKEMLDRLGFDDRYIDLFKNPLFKGKNRSFNESKGTFSVEDLGAWYDKEEDYVWQDKESEAHNIVTFRNHDVIVAFFYDTEIEGTKMHIRVSVLNKIMHFDFPELEEDQFFNVADGFLFSDRKVL